MKSKFRTLFIVIWIFVGITVLLGLSLQIPFVQKEITHFVVQKIADKYGLKTSIEKIKFSFPSNVFIENCIIQKDTATLLRIDEIEIGLLNWLMQFKSPSIQSIHLNGVIAKGRYKDGKWNFDFEHPVDTTEQKQSFKIDLSDIQITNATIEIDDSERHFKTFIPHFATAINISDQHIEILKLNAKIKTLFIQDLGTPKGNLPHQKKIDLGLIENKIIDNFFSFFQNTQPLSLRDINIKIDSTHWNINNGKSHNIENFNFNLSEITKQKKDAQSDFTMSGIYLGKRFNLSVLGQIHNNKIELEKFDAHFGESQYRMIGQVQMGKKKNTLQGSMEILPSTINLYDICDILNYKTKMPNHNFAFQTKSSFVNHVFSMKNTKLFLEQNEMIKIDHIEASHLYNIDSIQCALKNIQMQMDSNRINKIKKMLQADSLLPSSQLFNSISFLHYNGNALIKKQHSQCDGILKSNLGNVVFNTNYNTSQNKKNINGLIRFNTLDGGAILNIKDVKQASIKTDFNLTLEGKKIQIGKSTTHIDTIVFRNKICENITAKTDYIDHVLHSNINIHNTDCDWNALIALDFRNNNSVTGNISSVLEKLNLNEFKKNLVFKNSSTGNFFYDKTKEALTVSLALKNNQLESHRYHFNLENIDIDYQITEGEHNTKIISNNIGFINITGLEQAANAYHFLQQKTKQLITNTDIKNNDSNSSRLKKNMTASIHLNHLEQYKLFFSRHIEALSSLDVEVSFNEENHFLDATIKSQRFKNKSIDVFNFFAEYHLNGNILSGNIQADSIQLIDKIMYTKPTLSLFKNRDGGTLSIESIKRNHWLDIKGIFEHDVVQKNTTLLFDSSLLVFNKKPWAITQNAKIILSQDNIDVENTRLQHGEEQILFERTQTKTNEDWKVTCKSIQIKPVIEIVSSDLNIQGQLDGSILFSSMNTNDKMAGHFMMNKMIFNEDSIGKIEAFIETKKSHTIFDLQTFHPDYDIHISNKNLPIEGNEIGYAEIKNLNTKILSPYLKDVFYSVNGFIRGDVKLLQQDDEKYVWNGTVSLNKVALGVEATKCLYKILPTTVQFTDTRILFNEFKFQDIDMNIGKGSGVVNLDFNDFQKFYYDFQLNALDIFAYNTTRIDNDLFYGKVFGKLSLHTKGNLKGDSLEIDLKPNKNTDFYFNSGLNKNSNFEKIVNFKKPVVYYMAAEKETTERDFLLQINIDASTNNAILFHLIMDKTTDETMTLKAIPNLKINYTTNEGFQLYGKVDALDGQYAMQIKLPGLSITKDFLIDKGVKNYILFTGDPSRGEINVKAKYIAKNINPTTIGINPNTLQTNTNSVAGSSNSIALADVDVITFVKGNLSHLDFTFDLNYAENSPIVTDQNYTIYNAFLQNLKSNQTELIKQASYLIIFNSFANATQNNSNNNSTTSSLSNTALLSLASATSNYVNSLVRVQEKSFNLGLNSNVYNTYETNANTTTNQTLRSQLGLGFKKDISPKLSLSSDVNLDFALPTNTTTPTTNTNGTTSNIQILPNANLSYLILNNPIFKLNANAFCRSAYDNFVKSARYKTGVSLSFNQEFSKRNKK